MEYHPFVETELEENKGTAETLRIYYRVWMVLDIVTRKIAF